ncbi:hypothetical protein DFH08DRAFT_918689 [Mycena albidolilacea]|uniref:Helitron helicase-like domain-containing protein n=1 Tax=Mycena albidolilacea TaxID=1033008 RepID=A0AAD6Z2S9_9AGAR|nr:hypothetical protein DFH08DRAFT_918689 [Mycena albidolilacea]
MSESFIKNVLGVGADRPGLYGETDAYYGTVEQQGRLTLHMHMLIWIKSALSPLEIRNRLLNPDQQFQKDLVAYLESCHVGEFLTGTMSEVKAKVPYRPTARKGLHEVIESEEYNPVPEGYSDPTQTLPDAPPPLCTDYSKKLEPGAKIKREVRGCLRKDGTCSARFPRDVFTKTEVDLEDGYINLKKLEPMINTVTPDVTYLLRCNTDVTSLLSGTSIKAVVAYVSDYITKSSLKIYHMFESVNSVLKRQTIEIGVSPIQKNNCRKLLMQMIGSPMASLYLLKHPDHYTNHKFKPFWWKSYPVVAAQPGEAEINADVADQLVLMKTKDCFVGATNIDDYVWRSSVFENICLYDYMQMAMRVKRTPKQLAEFTESVKDDTGPNMIVDADDNQNDWLENDLERQPQEDLLDVTAGDVSSHPFHENHPLWESHYTRCDRNNLATTVPNFVGGALPRMDQGDREYYCCTMLTLFKPWRDPMHLKDSDASWHDGFTEHTFSDKANTLMKHFNIRYECNDARDDYSSLDKQKRRAMPLFDGDGSKREEGLDYVEMRQTRTDLNDHQTNLLLGLM